MNTIQDSIAELYIVAFNRAPEKSGIDNWVYKMQQDNLTIIDIMNLMLETSAAKELYGSKFDNNEDFINEIYKNALGKDKTTDPEGVKAWAGFLDKGMSRGETVVKLIETAKSDEAKKADATAAKIFENKAEVSKYMASKFNYVPKKEDGKFNFEIFQKPLADVRIDNLNEIKANIDNLSKEFNSNSNHNPQPNIEIQPQPKPIQPSKGEIKLYDGIITFNIEDAKNNLKAGDVFYGRLELIKILNNFPDVDVVYKDNGVYITNLEKYKNQIVIYDDMPSVIFKEKTAGLPSVNNFELKPLQVESYNGNNIILKGNLNKILRDGFSFDSDDPDDVSMFFHTGIQSDSSKNYIIDRAKHLINYLGKNEDNDPYSAEKVIDGHFYVLEDIDESSSLSSGDLIIKFAGSNDNTPIESVHFIEIF